MLLIPLYKAHPSSFRDAVQQCQQKQIPAENLWFPKLQDAGWDNEPHSIAEQRTITDGRVVPVGNAPVAGLVWLSLVV